MTCGRSAAGSRLGIVPSWPRRPFGPRHGVRRSYEVRRDVELPGDQIAVWAATRIGECPAGAEEAWADWGAATFSPLEQDDAQLAVELAGLLVDEFLKHGGLSARRKDEALASLGLRRGVTPGGTLILGADLPLGEGHPEYGWDGSRSEALEIVVAMGQTAGQNISAERTIVGPTGWEPEYDDTAR